MVIAKPEEEEGEIDMGKTRKRFDFTDTCTDLKVSSFYCKNKL